MKKFNLGSALLLAAFVLQGSTSAFAAPGENRYHVNGGTGGGSSFGLGFMVGSEAGVTAKIWTSDITAFALGVGFANSRSTTISADYLWHLRDTQTFVPYLGIGAVGGFGGRSNFINTDNTSGELGVRVPIGIEILPQGVPLGFFAELDPGYAITPNNYSFFEANVGGRYYF